MAFKFALIFCAIFAYVNAGFLSVPIVAEFATPSVDAVASTHENVVRSFGGTVSTHSKAIDTPYPSVHKIDSRISNNLYTPAIAKTYVAPAKTITYNAPIVAKTFVAPVPTVAAYTAPVAPVIYSHSHITPAVVSHVTPVIKQAISYSPAIAVAHVAFDGFGAHWGY